ncbi:hypothetical protein scyTo_0008519 [Scyliorhinus torazame]|uniref:Uncharacterized protein n=1 Tax=Scyliorhinus torazame TaxID=75743 RepID=A0A401PAR0_SCYTO|nr:hypothetical protein [Scyliorhinus torazame]
MKNIKFEVLGWEKETKEIYISWREQQGWVNGFGSRIGWKSLKSGSSCCSIKSNAFKNKVLKTFENYIH